MIRLQAAVPHSSFSLKTRRETPMVPGLKAGFELDARLEADSVPLLWLGLCELRIMNDRRWPWLLLVPQRPGVEEIHDMTPLDQAMLTFECNTVAHALKRVTACTKINTGALGNIVRQLHVHVIARNEGDPGWPGPVWGHGMREPYPRADLHGFCEKVRGALQ
jgi:diadenosine tetraphosphate (Ap4A) HIT family hydrolase